MFDWLDRFQKRTPKADDYAEKTLAAYRLGIRAKGSIQGVEIVISDDGCPASLALDRASVYDPSEAPLLPLPDCDRREYCRCVYRPVMQYQKKGAEPTGK